MGRVIETVENFTGDGLPTDSANRVTLTAYDGAGHVAWLTAALPGGVNQTTHYAYGVTGVVSSNDLLGSVVYPANGQPNVEQYSYNALGEVTGQTDRNGTTHAYGYDVLGRQTADAVTALGTGVDGAVQRIETGYDGQGNAYAFTSYNAAAGGGGVNQVLRWYNGLGQVLAEAQYHGDPATTAPGVVQYAYSAMAGGANHSRLVSMTYPNGRVLYDNYGAGLDDALSRLTSLTGNADGTGALEAYRYLGLDTAVKRARPQPGEELTYVKRPGESTGDAGDPYTGLDRFGRVVDQRWVNSATGAPLDEYRYGYDRDGNVLYRENVANALFSELYHSSAAGSGYDGFNRLTDFSRGQLNATHDGLTGAASRTQGWQLDALGNWNAVTGDGSTQTRTHNAQNQIASISGAATPGYDANGNTTADEAGQGYVYDAWNRLVGVNAPGGGLLESYAYDGLGRRVVERSAAARDLYYSAAWQVVEQRLGGATQAQYVWGPLSVDALVARETGGTRLYAQQDANGNVTSVVNAAGAVQERYVYDPYGKASYLDAGWNALAGSAVGWVYLHQGGRYDGVSGLYQFRNRDFSPTLGRWLQQDPASYVDGLSRYQYDGSSPAVFADPYGLCGCVGGGKPSGANKFWGVIKFIGGAAQFAGGVGLGAASSPTGVGVLVGGFVAVRGLDNMAAAVRQMYTGQETSTYMHRVVAKGSGNCDLADIVDLSIDLVSTSFVAKGIANLDKVLGAGARARRLEKYSPRHRCFPAGTVVATQEGARPIERVGSGEAVWSFDFRAGRWVLCRVAVCHAATYEGEFLTLVFEDGTSLEVTADHPLWVAEGDGLAGRPQLHLRDAYEDSGLSLPGRWVHSQAVRVGDQLYGQGQGCLRVVGIRSRQDCLEVYNLSVLGLPYYAVGPLGILVHNTESNAPSGNPSEIGRRTTIDPTSEKIIYREGVDERSKMSGTKIDSYKPFDQALSDAEQPIRVVRHDGSDYIMQGNHRMVGAGEGSVPQVEVILYTPAEWELFSGQPFSPWGTNNPLID